MQVPKRAVTVQKRSESKFHNKKVTVYGETFDSIHEKDRWLVLKQRQREGKISDLRRQVKFELIPKQYINGKVVEKSVVYVADFTYYKPDGSLVVEDAKGMKKGTAYAVFVIKRKLMLERHRIQVQEV